MSETAPLRVGQTLIGPLFNEPMRVETVSAAGNSSWVVGLVGAQSEGFRRVTMSESDLAAISVLDAEMAFNGDGNLLRLGIQAYTLGIAHDFDPYFGLSISRVDEQRMGRIHRYGQAHCNTTPRLREPIGDTPVCNGPK